MMKQMIVLALTTVLFTACGNDNPTNQNQNIKANNKTNTSVLNACSEDNIKSAKDATDAINKISSYFNQDGTLTDAGQFADVNTAVISAKTDCQYFVNNYGPIDCKAIDANTQTESVIHGSDIAQNCDTTVKFLTSIGR